MKANVHDFILHISSINKKKTYTHKNFTRKITQWSLFFFFQSFFTAPKPGLSDMPAARFSLAACCFSLRSSLLFCWSSCLADEDDDPVPDELVLGPVASKEPQSVSSKSHPSPSPSPPVPLDGLLGATVLEDVPKDDRATKIKEMKGKISCRQSILGSSYFL